MDAVSVTQAAALGTHPRMLFLAMVGPPRAPSTLMPSPIDDTSGSGCGDASVEGYGARWLPEYVMFLHATSAIPAQPPPPDVSQNTDVINAVRPLGPAR